MKGVHCSWVDMYKIRDALLKGGPAGLFSRCLAFESRQDLPEEPGVYLAFADDTPLYVGMSGDLRRRWVNHEISPFLRILPCPLLAYVVINPLDLRPAERERIHYYWPVWQRPPCCKPTLAVARLSEEIERRNELCRRAREAERRREEVA